MNRSKRLFCMLLVCLIAGTATLAEEPAQEITASPASVAVQAPAESVPAPVAEPAAEPAPAPVAVPAAEPAAEPAVESVPAPTAESAAEPAPAPVAEPAAEPASEPTAGLAVEPAAEQAAESKDEPAPETTEEAASKPATESGTEPTAGPSQEATSAPTLDSTAEPNTVPTAEAAADPAEGPAADSTAEPTAEPTEDPTAEPTEEPAEDPTADPTEEPAEDSTAEPTADPTEAPTVDPTEAPTAAPTEEPAEEPTTEPTAEPTVGPTAVPIEQIVVTVAGSAQQVENVWQIAVQNPEEQIVFQWSPVEAAAVYEVRIVDSQNAGVHATETAETTWSLPASAFGTDMYVMIVSAYSVADTEEAERVLIKQGVMRFQLVQNQEEKPGGFPGGFGGFGSFGGGRPGGFGGGAMQGGEMPEEQGFRVTPGEALTSSHTSGNKDMRLYGTVEPMTQEESMTILTMDDVQLDITLDEQNGSFFVSCEENTLILTPENEGAAWSVNAYALKMLERSGISRIRLMFGSESVEISTQWNPQGREYAHLCTAGYVSKDYMLTVTLDETLVTVADAVYRINENNELVGG